MSWWLSAAFTALLVVTVVGVGFYFLPVMFAPPRREPDFSDVDELLKVSRPVPDIGTSSAAHPAGTVSGGFPVGSPPVPACSVSGEPPHTRRETE